MGLSWPGCCRAEVAGGAGGGEKHTAHHGEREGGPSQESQDPAEQDAKQT